MNPKAQVTGPQLSTTQPAPPAEPSKPPSGLASNKKFMAVALVVLLLIVGGGGYLLHSHSNKPKTPQSAQPSLWGHYNSTKYGLQFDYLKSWGSPSIQQKAGLKGENYFITFNKSKDAKRVIMASFASVDEVTKGPANCPANVDCDVKAMTAATINTAVASSQKSSFLRYDTKSYSIMVTDSISGISNELALNYIINLTKVNSTAVQISYTLAGNTPCSATALAANTNTKCINNADYQNLTAFAASIKNL